MNINEVEDALYAWTSDTLNIETIFAYPNVGRPTTSYVVFNVFGDTSNGTYEKTGIELSDDSIDVTYSSLNQIVVSVNIYYNNAYQVAKNIKNSLMRMDVQEQLWEAGLGYVSTTNIQKIPEAIDGVWEERAQFDITFNIRENVTSNIEAIRKVEVTNELDGTTTTIGES